VRSLVVLASLAVPLVGASAAQAALAGANPLTTTNRPDLRTVTLTSASTAQFCFDQAIAQVPSQTGFHLGGYSAANVLASTNPTAVDTANNHCVDATFPISIGDTDDLTQYTYGEVDDSAVLAQVGTGFVGNIADSTALQGSSTHNGTAGRTTAPDLTGVTVDNVNTGNTLDYIYDQNVQISSVHPGDFHAFYADGTELTGVTSVVAGGNVVKVTFGSPLSSPTHGPTVIAVNTAGAVSSQTAEHTLSTIDTFAVSGTSGASTTRPDLIAAQLSTDGTYVDYTFDKPLNGAAPNAGDFQEWSSLGGTIGPAPATCAESSVATSSAVAPCTAGGLSQLPNNVVRVFFPTQSVQEYLVKASVTPGAVHPAASVAGGLNNTWGEVPIGDNQGAFAEGFTTGPDAFRVTFDNATNTATVLFDQRVFGTNHSSFILLDANGTPLPGGTGVAAGPAATAPQTPGPYQITVSYTGASVANAKALEIAGIPTATAPAAFTAFGPLGSSVQQVVSPTGAAAILKPGSKLRFVKIAVHSKKHHKTHKKHSSKKHHKG
jgi:hypothetical protein